MRLNIAGISPLSRFLLMLGVGVSITVVTGVVCGRVSQRWGPVPDMIAAAKHLKSLPMQIGSWQMVKEDELTEAEIQTLTCAGYVNRTYVDQKTGDTISLAIIVGPAGPISVHTPEICYSSQAYSIPEPRQLQKVADKLGKSHAFWRTIFRSPNATAEQLCVYYGWCADREWIAAESPRFEFAGRPMLFKLQIASQVPPGHINERNACEAFLRELLESDWNVSG
jgi:hypothetical protein